MLHQQAGIVLRVFERTLGDPVSAGLLTDGSWRVAPSHGSKTTVAFGFTLIAYSCGGSFVSPDRPAANSLFIPYGNRHLSCRDISQRLTIVLFISFLRQCSTHTQVESSRPLGVSSRSMDERERSPYLPKKAISSGCTNVNNKNARTCGGGRCTKSRELAGVLHYIESAAWSL